LVNVKLRVVLLPVWIVAAPNALVRTGAAATVNVPHAWLVALPPFVEVGVTQFCDDAPAGLLSVTLKVTAQEAPPAKLPPVSEAVAPPAVAVAVPPHVFVRFGIAATTTPAGRVSTKPTPVRVVEAFGFVIVMFTLELLPVETLEGVNVLVPVGGRVVVAGV
jgi:hypothetical protein